MTKEQIALAKNRAYKIEEKLNSDLVAGRITEEQWYAENTRIFTETYLSGENPRAQSGHGGDAAHYANKNSLILAAIDHGGSFLDVGCANGHLIESIDTWAVALGFQSEMHGLDISEVLIDLARSRLPEWRERFYLGNALTWVPPRLFDYVLMRELGYVPPNRERELFEHVLTLVSPGGRFIFGRHTAEIPDREIDTSFRRWGHSPTGYLERSHDRYDELCRRLYWFDKEGAS